MNEMNQLLTQMKSVELNEHDENEQFYSIRINWWSASSLHTHQSDDHASNYQNEHFQCSITTRLVQWTWCFYLQWSQFNRCFSEYYARQRCDRCFYSRTASIRCLAAIESHNSIRSDNCFSSYTLWKRIIYFVNWNNWRCYITEYDQILCHAHKHLISFLYSGHKLNENVFE